MIYIGFGPSFEVLPSPLKKTRAFFWLLEVFHNTKITLLKIHGIVALGFCGNNVKKKLYFKISVFGLKAAKIFGARHE